MDIPFAESRGEVLQSLGVEDLGEPIAGTLEEPGEGMDIPSAERRGETLRLLGLEDLGELIDAGTLEGLVGEGMDFPSAERRGETLRLLGLEDLGELIETGTTSLEDFFESFNRARTVSLFKPEDSELHEAMEPEDAS